MVSKKLYLNLGIKYKILILFYSVVVLLSSISGLLSYYISQKNLIQKVSVANLGTISQVSSTLDFIFKSVEDTSTFLCIDSSVNKFLTSKKASKGNVINNFLMDNSLEFVLNLLLTSDSISMTVIYSDNLSSPFYFITDSSSGLDNNFTNIKKSSIYNSALNLKGKPMWFYMGYSNPFLLNNNYPKMSMCRIIKDTNNSKNIGFIILSVNLSYIQKICSDNIHNQNESIFIMDSMGNVISQAGAKLNLDNKNNEQFLQQLRHSNDNTSFQKIDGKDYLLSYSKIARTKCGIYYAVPKNSLNKEISSIRILILIIILASLLLFFPLMLIMSTFLTAPIRRLLKSMKKFQEGNFDEKVEIKQLDEMGTLGQGYNEMVKNIKDLIQKNYVLDLKEHEAELNALQAQINPHFLYNTLDTIYWKAQKQKQSEISEMVYSLSMLFRLSLNRGKSFTLVKNEKELIEHYLLLQKIRFKERLSFEIEIDDDILKYVVPKLLLQPFVENAILHGLEGKMNGGLVRIIGKRQDSMLKFIIEDNGIGMTQDAVNKLFEENEIIDVNDSVLPGGYAVKNVNDRLKINYNGNYSLNFSSEPDVGTKVEILLPILNFNESGAALHD